jgi:hypothetical protein
MMVRASKVHPATKLYKTMTNLIFLFNQVVPSMHNPGFLHSDVSKLVYTLALAWNWIQSKVFQKLVRNIL